MASFLTALANIGSQYAEGRTAGQEEKEKLAQEKTQTELSQRRLALEESQQDIERQRLTHELKQPDIAWIDVGDKRKLPWSYSQGKFVDPKEIPGYQDPTVRGMQSLAAYINQQDPKDRAKLQQIAVSGAGVGMEPEALFKDIQAAQGKLEAERDKRTAALGRGVPPEILAQFPRPDPANYAQSENDPIYQVDLKKWGFDVAKFKRDNAEEINKMKASDWRGLTYNTFIDPQTGGVKTGTWREAEANGWIASGVYMKVGGELGRVDDIRFSSYQFGNAIKDLKPGDAFTPSTVALLQTAAGNLDMGLVGKYVPGAENIKQMLENEAKSYTNPRQYAYLMWLAQLQESAMAMTRLGSAIGRGGAIDMRDAIRATLPGINEGSIANAISRLKAFDAEVDNLVRYIPRIPAPPLAPYSPVGAPAEGTGTVQPVQSPAVDQPGAPQSSSPDVGPGRKQGAPVDPNNPLGLTPPPGMH